MAAGGLSLENHLDAAALAELEEIMEDDFGILLETYIDDADNKLTLLCEALKSGDANSLREVAHSLKGASSNVGAIPLSKLCEDVEHLAKNNQVLEITPLLPGIRDEYQEVKSLLQQKL